MSFHAPAMFLLLLVPFVVRWLVPGMRQQDGGDAPEILFPAVERVQKAFKKAPQPTNNSPWMATLLLGLSWFCLTSALAQPEIIDHFTETKSEGHDIMLLVDLSGSMHALDFSLAGKRVDRLQIIKQVVGRFVQERQGDRLGLVLFGQHAYLQAPLSPDTLAIGALLNDAAIGEAGDSTAIGDAIGVAVKNLRDRQGHSKIIILLTDGGDNASTIPPLEAAKLAQQYGIRIYTVGVGTQGPVPIPDQNGQIVYAEMDLDEGLLQKIADITEGSYFRAADTAVLQKAYDQIDAMEKTESEAHSYLVRTPLFRYPLGAALLFLFGYALLPVMIRALP